MLTGKQESFCQAVAGGMTLSDAYRSAYDTSRSKPSSINVRASELMSDSKIIVRVDTLRKELADKGLWSREDSIKTMTEIIRRKVLVEELEVSAARDSDIISAVKVINEMQGFNAPVKTEHSGGVITKIQLVALT